MDHVGSGQGRFLMSLTVSPSEIGRETRRGGLAGKEGWGGAGDRGGHTRSAILKSWLDRGPGDYVLEEFWTKVGQTWNSAFQRCCSLGAGKGYTKGLSGRERDGVQTFPAGLYRAWWLLCKPHLGEMWLEYWPER